MKKIPIIAFVEGISDQLTLKILINRIAKKEKKDIDPKVYNLGGYDNLKKKLVTRLGKTPHGALCLVLVDQDNEECKDRKKELCEIINKTGKAKVAIVRIACQELESFFLGDLEALRKVQGKKKPIKLSREDRKSFDNPDNKRKRKPSTILNKVICYDKGDKDKIEEIAENLSIKKGANTSPSFNALLASIKKLLREAEPGNCI